MILSDIQPAAAFRQCSISVMDTVADPHITFNEQGVCHYFFDYQRKNSMLPKDGPERVLAFDQIVQKIKHDGAGKQYDSIMGLSGGVDSTYIACLAMKAGLRPLAVHFDNGWNSEIADANIANITKVTGFPLLTIKMDGDEFRDIQLAYLKASVTDIEAPTDHAIFTTLFKLAGEHKISYILSGTNHQTECTMPKSWNFSKMDHVNIKAIHKKFGKIPLKTFPLMDAKMKRFSVQRNQLQSVSLLHYVDYNKSKVKELIKKEFAWQDYGGKHYESVWTKFYQGYILPTKFSIDKRKAHLSDLIFAGQITKEEAIKELAKPLYDPGQLIKDKEFVLEKLGLAEEEFEAIMNTPVRSHYDFDYEKPIDVRYPILKPVKRLYRTLFPVK